MRARVFVCFSQCKSTADSCNDSSPESCKPSGSQVMTKVTIDNSIILMHERTRRAEPREGPHGLPDSHRSWLVAARLGEAPVCQPWLARLQVQASQCSPGGRSFRLQLQGACQGVLAQRWVLGTSAHCCPEGGRGWLQAECTCKGHAAWNAWQDLSSLLCCMPSRLPGCPAGHLTATATCSWMQPCICRAEAGASVQTGGQHAQRLGTLPVRSLCAVLRSWWPLSGWKLGWLRRSCASW